MLAPGVLTGRRFSPAVVYLLALVTAASLGGHPASAISGPGATEGALSVQTDPAGAAVYVDGRFVGETPLTLPALAAGDHRVRVVKDGYLENSRIVRVSTGKSEALQLRLTSRAGQAAAAQAGGLQIVVIEGEDAVNIIQQKTAVRPVVEVRDRNGLPVAGASVLFTIGGGGGGGATFAGGASTVTVTTDAAGRAAGGERKPVSNGQFQIRVDVSYQGQTGTTTITQTNFMTLAQAAAAGKTAGAAGAGAGGGGLSNLAIAGIVGGAAAGTVGILAATGTIGGGSAACTFAVSPTTVAVGSAAGTSTVNVTVSPANCDPPTWTTAATSAPFVTINPTSGSGNGSVTLSIAANTGAQRNGTVTIANQTVTITQSAACTFAVSPTVLTAPAAGGALTVTVTASPAGCGPATWNATSASGFITPSPSSGTGNGTVTLTVAANTGTLDRSGTATVAGQTVTVNQSRAAQPCNSQQVAGGDIPETRTIELGRTSGTFGFTYDTASIEDRLVVRYQNAILFDTGCVGTNGPRTQNITYSGTSTTVTVEVTPNCRVPGSGTAWVFILSCPQ
jgi:hypothetical protein